MSRRASRAKNAASFDANTRRLYQKFSSLLVDASRAAELAHTDPDVSQAINMLTEYPQLRTFLDVVRERETAKSVAMQRSDATLSSFIGPDGVVAKGSPTASTPQDQGASAWGGNRNQPIGVANSRLLREWADTNEWCRAAINVRRIQIGRADIMVTPADANKPYDRKVMKQVQMLLDQPNELRDSYRSLIEPVLEDVLVLDRGVISKNMTSKRIPVALYPEDGATIKIYPGWSGNPKEPRYLYEDPAGTHKVPLRNDEAIVIMANQATHRYGLSPMTILQNTIRADLKATQSAMHMVDMKPPPHMVQLTGISQTVLDKLVAQYDQTISGRKELFFIGGKDAAHVFPLVFSAKDNQWMEWQEYLARKIAVVFQISPQQLGLTFDINRATAEQQQSIFEDTGLIPLLLLLEEYLNRELLSDFAPPIDNVDWHRDLDALNLRIIYPEVSEASRRMHTEKMQDMFVKGLAGLPSMTLNKALAMQGDPPVKGGNTFWYAIGQSILPVASYDNDLGVYADVMIGQQDASTGPLIMDPPKPADETPGKRRIPKPVDGADTAHDETSGNGQAPNFQETKSYHLDARQPGKSWSVRHSPYYTGE